MAATVVMAGRVRLARRVPMAPRVLPDRRGRLARVGRRETPDRRDLKASVAQMGLPGRLDRKGLPAHVASQVHKDVMEKTRRPLSRWPTSTPSSATTAGCSSVC